MKFCSISCSDIARSEKLSVRMKEYCSIPENRDRLRDIGRKGGFGKRGVTNRGTRYESSIERDIFCYLEENDVDFIPHKNIPNSSKVSDVYIPRLNLWIEIDGINREKRKKWLGKHYQYWKDKLLIYEQQKLNYVIVYSLEDFMLVDGLVT